MQDVFWIKVVVMKMLMSRDLKLELKGGGSMADNYAKIFQEVIVY